MNGPDPYAASAAYLLAEDFEKKYLANLSDEDRRMLALVWIGDLSIDSAELERRLRHLGIAVTVEQGVRTREVSGIAELEAQKRDREPAQPQPSYLQHDPTKAPRRQRKGRRGGPRYVTKGFWG